ncbi:MEKHLA domain-containing protein [Methylocaldum sp.]|uniref:MEKHLA domain-containing protein n=1 Tax=Methylocaldum sp. TaxID=1969727 RepID=UPI002D599B5C|nr:MEKHLA domain-containing protein [Methylocaldum sp.]HYE37594.1 MEKHLA domain-containing protein [Methylocaldum sp.]
MSMTAFPKPSEENSFLADHVAILRNSYRHWTKRELVDPRMNDCEAARYLFSAPFVVLSHDTAKDPVFNYANQTAMTLFGMNWEELTAFPSRLSSEREDREERRRLLAEVTARGYIDDYRGIRIARHGRRFLIEHTTIWNLLDTRGVYCGQAASFAEWKFL